MNTAEDEDAPVMSVPHASSCLAIPAMVSPGLGSASSFLSALCAVHSPRFDQDCGRSAGAGGAEAGGARAARGRVRGAGFEADVGRRIEGGDPAQPDNHC